MPKKAETVFVPDDKINELRRMFLEKLDREGDKVSGNVPWMAMKQRYVLIITSSVTQLLLHKLQLTLIVSISHIQFDPLSVKSHGVGLF